MNKSLKEIEEALGVDNLVLTPLAGGTNDRTFFANTEKGEFVVRIEQGNGVQLRRAYNAQKRAEALGVMVPKVVTHNFGKNHDHDWIVEEKVDGVAFFPDKMDEVEAKSTSFDLGKQLKKLHLVEVDRYGLLPPFPYQDNKDWSEKDKEEFEQELERNGPIFSSFSDHIDFKKKVVEKSFELAGLEARYISRVKEVYERLKSLYSGGPRFCEGDTATTNLIVKDGKVKAMIDWEWAQASDPAENVAYWHYWNKDSKYLDYFLEGYQPEDPEKFRERIDLYQITTAIHLINVFKEMGHERWIKGAKEKLEGILKAG